MNDRARKEPSLADLEAFERLLRESLHTDPTSAGNKSAHLGLGHPQDQAALAELSRLIDQPLNFDLPQFPEPPKPARNHLTEPEAEMPQPVAPPGAPVASWEFPTLEARPSSAEEQALRTDPPPFEHTLPPVAPPPVAPAAGDPLLAFEDELRRFDSLQMSAPPAPQVHAPELRPAMPGHARIEMPQAQSYMPGQNSEQVYAPEPGPLPASEAGDPLAAAEDRLAAEAAIAAAAAPPPKRSKGVFLGLGGIAVAGVVVIAASSFFSSSPKPKSSSGAVPVVAAKTQPTKEKPADPGGIEIPGQNAQILASRGGADANKPAQAVNTTEQPVDLNQVQRRDSVRIIAPNPYANSQPNSPAAPSAPASGDTPAAGAEPGPLEARRVQSVRIPAPVAPSVQSGTAPRANVPVAGAPALALPNLGIPALGTQGNAPSARPGQIAPSQNGASAGATRPGAIPQPTPPRASAPPPSPEPPPAPEATPEPPPAQTTARPPSPPRTTPPSTKVETRPAPPARTANAPRPANPPARPFANAPLSLTPPGSSAPAAAAPRAAAGAGTYAIQLASRPTEADARSASNQLKSRYSGTLAGRNPSVTSGEANGKAVYRVRVGGYSQADANAACAKIKAAGGGCFVTRQ